MEGPNTEQQDNIKNPEAELPNRIKFTRKRIKDFLITGIAGVGIVAGASALSDRIGDSAARADVVSVAGEEGGKLYDKFGIFYKNDLDAKKKNQEGHGNDRPIAIDSLETDYGVLSAEDIKTVIDESYPKGWFEKNVSAVKVVGQDLKDPWGEATPGQTVATTTPDGNGKSVITFYKPARRVGPIFNLRLVMPHESCHAYVDGLPQGERAHIMEAVSQRVGSADRFVSGYVEKIDKRFLGVTIKKARDYSKAMEYWAEICNQFFLDPTQLNVKDFDIVNSEIQRFDPTFNWKLADDRNQAIYKSIDPNYSK